MTSVLTINSGSSSLKASLFLADGTRRDFRYTGLHHLEDAFTQLMDELAGQYPDLVGHRMVHGGALTDAIRRVDDAEVMRLQGLVHLAPLHLPGNLLGLALCRRYFSVPQFVCFDTAFHHTLPELAWRLAIPQHYGLRKYGFHGLNYAYVASILPQHLGEIAYGKVVVAHLGSGASLCLMENLRSQDTTMAYTPAAGIPMGTRSGDLDPGVMLELARQHDLASLRDIVFHQMGLLALSDGISNDMGELLRDNSRPAQFAIDYFCRQVCACIAALAAKAGGIDALIFTAGIGENCATIRQKICANLAFIGIELDQQANQTHQTRLSTANSKPVLIIKADEESMIRQLCLSNN